MFASASYTEFLEERRHELTQLYTVSKAMRDVPTSLMEHYAHTTLHRPHPAQSGTDIPLANTLGSAPRMPIRGAVFSDCLQKENTENPRGRG